MRRILHSILTIPLWAHAAAIALTIVWFQWIKAKLDASYAASLHPVDYATGQTTFSGETIKTYYAAMSETGTLDIYVKTQLIDFGFVLAFVCIGLFFCTLIARLSRPDSYGRTAGILAGVAIITGAFCDAIENGWSFIMLANPTGFADWLAIPYSLFAVLKFGCITIGMALVIISLVLACIGRLSSAPRLG
ncbi:hypothetical protein N9O61_04550 [Octadecabacter sp.]|nr:hypothetical protein [Octadecabacter sp.]